jgi:hypothetical protein
MTPAESGTGPAPQRRCQAGCYISVAPERCMALITTHRRSAWAANPRLRIRAREAGNRRRERSDGTPANIRHSTR